ncbi:MAG: LacI family transcriptional regulator [Propionibacteriaceae bacterium]|nr:LacI family transcriptional regulator [Propionibacteriaceae bacterium]
MTTPLRPRTPSMMDVAKHVGVSHQTVSRVINNHPAVKDDTRQRVQAAMAEIGYRRNRSARALVTNRTFTIGALVANSHLYGPSTALMAIERSAHAQGYSVTVSAPETSTAKATASAISRLIDLGVDGIVAIAPTRSVLAATITAAADMPLVALTSGDVSGTDVSTIDIDQIEGARLAVRHLIGLGHQKIAFLAGPEDDFHAECRLEGWKQAMTAAGLDGPMISAGSWLPNDSYRLAKQFLSDDRSLTALFTANDHMALGALRAAHELGRSVPEMVSVVGFDDIPGASHFIPPLTTVRQQIGVIGAMAVDALVNRIGGGEPETRLIRPRLIERASTAAPPE